MGLGKGAQVWKAGHAAVVVQDLADHARRGMARQLGEVAAGLGMAGAGQHATGLSHQGKDVTRLNEVLGLGCRRHGSKNGGCTVCRTDAGGHPPGGLNGHRKCGGMGRAVLVNHHGQLKLTAAGFREGQADQATSKPGHEIDGLGRNSVGRHDQVALILAVFVVHQDHHATRPNGRDEIGNGLQWLRHAARPIVEPVAAPADEPSGGPWDRPRH